MKVKTPKEDPTIKSARDREERRADAAFIETTTGILDEETRKRIRRFGKRGAAVGRPGAGGGRAPGTPGSGVGGGGASGGGGSFDPGDRYNGGAGAIEANVSAFTT